MVSAVRGTPLRMDIIPRLAVRREGLQLLMLEHEPDIMHFSMHGIQDHLAAGKRAPENPRDLTPAERLVFSGGDRQPQFLDPKAVVNFFRIFERTELVVLNACWTAPIAEALSFRGPLRDWHDANHQRPCGDCIRARAVSRAGF
jgi:hypothetical protein